MDRGDISDRNDERDTLRGDSGASQDPINSKRLGDTQPFRPLQAYKPLNSERPVEEESFQQTAPYRPIQVVAPTAREKKVNRGLVLAVLALLLVIAATIAYFLIAKGGSGAGGASLPAEGVLPANILGYLSISPAPAQSQREAFGALLSTFEAQPGSREAIANLIVEARRIISGTGISLGSATDPATLETVARYLGGNITIALLAPSDGDLISLKVPAGGQVNQLAAFDVISRKAVGLVDLDFNPGGAQTGIIAQLRAVKDNLDKAKVVENYKGTDIREYTEGPIPVYFSLLNGTSTAAVGISSVPVKVLIDELRANKGLKEDAGFKTLSGQVPAERVATLYLNLNSLGGTMKALLPDATDTDKMQGATLMALSAQNEGAQVDIATQGSISDVQGPTVTLLGVTVDLAAFQVNPGAHPSSATLSEIPSDAMFFVAGSDLSTTISSTLDAMQKSGRRQGDGWRNGIKTLTGLDPDADILSWMGGDYTLSVSPSDVTPMSSPLVMQMKLREADSTKAANAISRGIEKLFNGKIQPVQAGGGTFYPLAAAGTAGIAVEVTKDRAMLITDESVAAAQKRAENTVSTSGKGFGAGDNWKAASAHVPLNSNLLSYLDVTAMRGIIERTTTDSETKANYNKLIAPFFRPIHYVAAGTVTDPAGTGNSSLNLTRIFVGISK